jgi:hypothetical protein
MHPDYDKGSRELEDIVAWHDWQHSQPCLNCLRPPDLPAVSADPVAEHLTQAPPATVPEPRRPRSVRRRNANDLVFPSRFTRTLKPIFENARLTVQQAQALEFLFLQPKHTATYTAIARATETTASVAVEMVGVMVKRGFLRRGGDGRSVTVDYAGWWVREDYPEWNAWIKACQPHRSGAS